MPEHPPLPPEPVPFRGAPMATNKRKDAAALFELIDKSTLKVPKHAGALKIPDWWSSKNNPAAAADAGKTAAQDSSLSDVKSTASKNTAALSDKSPPTPTPHLPTAGTAQPRLFEPPPPGSVPAVSPSIRPPASPATPSSTQPPTIGSTRPTVSSQASPASVPSSPSVSSSATATASTERAAGVRVFAPQTMDQGSRSRAPWGQHKRRMARTPRWAVLAALAGVVLIIALIVLAIWYVKGRSSNAGNATRTPADAQRAAEGTGGAGVPLLPPSNGTPTMPVPAPIAPEAGDHAPAAPEPEGSSAAAKVYGPHTVARTPELYYVVISSTPTASVAQKNADFLAAHGIDVSIEIVAGPGANTRWYKIISVRGFPSMVAAEPYRKRIVLIGHQHPDFKKYKKVWDDAFVSHVTTVANK